LVSSLGSGGRIDPSQIDVVDISKSYNCQFVQCVRKKLHGWEIRSGFKVVFSPLSGLKKALRVIENETNEKSMVGTISYMSAIFELTSASVVIRDLIVD